MDEDTKRSKRLLTWTGVLALIVGVVAIVVPAVASVGTAIFIGWVLLFAGVSLVFDAFSHGHLGGKLLRLLLALLTSAAGLYLLLAPLRGTFTLTVMLVIWFIAIGFARIAGGLVTLGSPGAGLTILSGAISLVLGILIAEELPSSADWAIGLLVGVDFLFFGMTALFGASALGKGGQSGAPTAPVV
jgi:uncharacterized membrane protein HdeD (DUF308 family)